MNKLVDFERQAQKEYGKSFPEFRVGDTIRVDYKIKEGDKERTHTVEGIVIKMQSEMNRRAFTVRRTSYGEGMEITFPLYSPNLERIELVQNAKRQPRRSRLYYLRGKAGKKANVV